MTTPLTLSTAPFEQPAMDFALLRQTGIDYLERLNGGLWTDFNTHDPGITILEQVCYALTDLAYRMNYAVPDLLSRDGQPTYDSLYTPAQILTSAPVTLDDLRKLVIDVDGVKSAWIEAAAQEFPLFYHADDNSLSLMGDPLIDDVIQLKGLWRIAYETTDLVYLDGNAGQEDAILQAVKQQLHAQRSLGEDFVEIAQLKPQTITIRARIEIESVEDVEQLLVAIYQSVAEHISPSIPFYTLRELLDAGQRVDEIFDGPVLDHGFIDTDQLDQVERLSVLRASDLIGRIMGVPGVRAVRTIAMSKGGTYEDWSLPLDSGADGQGQAPKFDPANSQIVLERNQLATQVDYRRAVNLYYQALRQASAQSSLTPDERDLQPPPGTDRHVGDYYSFQHQFPNTYGIGAAGLPDSASPQRKGQAKQLKAYLLFFDQLLANYFAQLAQVRDLFSFSGDSAQTYFSQAIDDPTLGLAAIYQADPLTYAAQLQQLSENPYVDANTTLGQANIARRNRFLNHLLARFAEQFTDYSLVLYGAITNPENDSAAALAQGKQQFLQTYPEISARRGTGYDYLAPRSSDNRSGLEKRIERKLNLNPPEERFYLIEHVLLRPMSGDDQQQVPLLAVPVSEDPYSLQLSFVFPKSLLTSRNTGFQEFAERTVREETPAHLAVTIHWLEDDAVAGIMTAYDDWLDKRRAYWLGQVGV